MTPTQITAACLLLVTPLMAVGPLHPDCFITGPGPPPAITQPILKENRTKVMLGYLTAVTGTMVGRQVRELIG